MSFAAPLAFSLFALGAAVLVLYILKVKRRPVVVPYSKLWESLAPETQSRSLFKRLRRWLSLLLQQNAANLFATWRTQAAYR